MKYSQPPEEQNSFCVLKKTAELCKHQCKHVQKHLEQADFKQQQQQPQIIKDHLWKD